MDGELLRLLEGGGGVLLGGRGGLLLLLPQLLGLGLQLLLVKGPLDGGRGVAVAVVGDLGLEWRQGSGFTNVWKPRDIFSVLKPPTSCRAADTPLVP